MKRIQAKQQGDQGGRDVRQSGVFARAERSPANRGGPLSIRPRAEGPCRSFEDIYARHKRDAWTWIRRAGLPESDAMDVFQGAFEDMHKRVGAHSVPSDAWPLLFTMIRARLTDHRRRQQRDAQRIDGEMDADTLPCSEPDPEQLLGGAESQEEAAVNVEIILHRMSPDAAWVLELSELYELSAEEIADSMDRPVGTVRVQLHRARATFCALAERLFHVTLRGVR